MCDYDLLFQRFDRADIAKLLLQRGADPLIENDINVTPLHTAARRGSKELCSLLLKDPRVQTASLNHGSLSPFHMACLSGNRDVCELFLKSDCDITSKNINGIAPLHIAAWKGYEEICQVLIEAGNPLISL